MKTKHYAIRNTRLNLFAGYKIDWNVQDDDTLLFERYDTAQAFTLTLSECFNPIETEIVFLS